VSQAFGVGLNPQTLTFLSVVPSNPSVSGAPYSVTASASSGLPATYSISSGSAAICTVSGSTVSFIGVGSCVVLANQNGNFQFNAAPQIQQVVLVGKGAQAVSFTSAAPTGAVVSGPSYTATFLSDRGLPVVLSVNTASNGICSVTGSVVTFLAFGNCVLEINQVGNVNYNAAPTVQQSFAVGKGNQVLTFTSPAPTGAVVLGATYSASATSSSGLAVTLSIATASSGVCSIANGVVSFTAAGSCTILANQGGNANFNAAVETSQSFAVGRGVVLFLFCLLFIRVFQERK
jgi:hypothetical protein